MEAKPSSLSSSSSSSSPSSQAHKPNSSMKPSSPHHKDFLTHLETYLAKRDGIDKLLKISRYASKIIIASSILPETLTLTHRLKAFESSVGVSRKAFRLGKFVQDLNALRNSHFHSNQELALSVICYGGEGFYYFVEQFIWFAKSGLIVLDAKQSRVLQKISAWSECIGYIGSVSLKVRDLISFADEEARLETCIEIAVSRGDKCNEEELKMRKLREKKTMKKLSVVQDCADGLMAIADIRDGHGRLSAPIVISCAGLFSALISTHKNWVSC